VGSYLTGAIVIPVKPLAPNATYTAEVTLAPNGELPAEQHRWTFRTGPANPSGVWPLWDISPREALPPRRRISKLRISPRAFTDGGRYSGARITYLDSGSGTTSFVVYRSGPGVLVGAQCASAASAAHNRRCSRLSRIYSFSHRDRPGRNSLRLTGRYGHRRLAPPNMCSPSSTSPPSRSRSTAKGPSAAPFQNREGGPPTELTREAKAEGILDVACPSLSLCVGSAYNLAGVTSTQPTGGPFTWKVGIPPGPLPESVTATPRSGCRKPDAHQARPRRPRAHPSHTVLMLRDAAGSNAHVELALRAH
jgi:hypothetical protein